ncbi:hydrolase 1, exosortase A system-associated, partial [Pseudomonas sp. GW460-C8]
AFADAARPYHGTLQMLFCETDSHSFAHPQDAEWLEQQIVAALSRLPEAG